MLCLNVDCPIELRMLLTYYSLEAGDAKVKPEALMRCGVQWWPMDFSVKSRDHEQSDIVNM